MKAVLISRHLSLVTALFYLVSLSTPAIGSGSNPAPPGSGCPLIVRIAKSPWAWVAAVALLAGGAYTLHLAQRPANEAHGDDLSKQYFDPARYYDEVKSTRRPALEKALAGKKMRVVAFIDDDHIANRGMQQRLVLSAIEQKRNGVLLEGFPPDATPNEYLEIGLPFVPDKANLRGVDDRFAYAMSAIVLYNAGYFEASVAAKQALSQDTAQEIALEKDVMTVVWGQFVQGCIRHPDCLSEMRKFLDAKQALTESEIAVKEILALSGKERFARMYQELDGMNGRKFVGLAGLNASLYRTFREKIIGRAYGPAYHPTMEGLAYLRLVEPGYPDDETQRQRNEKTMPRLIGQWTGLYRNRFLFSNSVEALVDNANRPRPLPLVLTLGLTHESVVEDLRDIASGLPVDIVEAP